MSQMFQVTGELLDSQHVKLDQPIPLPVGKVRIVVEPLAASGEALFAEMRPLMVDVPNVDDARESIYTPAMGE